MTAPSIAAPNPAVAESYKWCQRVARKQAKNFYYSFLLLSPERRAAMCAVYTFMRYCDDLSDAEGIPDRVGAIARWRDDLEAALEGRPGDHPVWPAFTDTVRRFSIPHEYFFDMIEGVSSDLEPRRIQTFDELYDYCYHVASVVGLTIIHIFGFRSPAAPKHAEACGVAFQLTNILRDVREDAGKNRIYLPAEDFRRFGVSADTFEPHENFLRMMNFESKRALGYYREAAPLLSLVNQESRRSLSALIAIYLRLLERIAESEYDVLQRRIHVPLWEKLWILARNAFNR